MALTIIKQQKEPDFKPGDKVRIMKKYRMLYNSNLIYDGVFTVKEFKEKVRLPPFLVDILYFEELPDEPNQSQYFEKVK